MKAVQKTTNGPSSSNSSCRITKNFDIRTDCLICEKSGTYKKKRLVSISTGTGSQTRKKILRCAIERNDTIMQGRMQFYTDLFAADAKYHTNCYAQYISKKNIYASNRQVKLPSKVTDVNAPFNILFQQITKEILKDRKCLTLNSLCKQLKNILEELNLDTKISENSGNIRKKIEKHFGETLCFLHQTGKPTLVLSKQHEYDIIYSRMYASDEDSNSEEEHMTQLNDGNENLILHNAAGILRKAIKNSKNENSCKYYVGPQEINENKCQEEIPKTLYTFLSWVLNEQYFADPSSSSCDITVISICSAILNNFDKVKIITTFSLCLSILVYQTVRSKKILDILFNFGYGISYDEIRKFLTSIALQQIQNNTEHDIFIPQGLLPINNENDNFIHGSIDNFDLNEETLDMRTC